MTGQRSFRASRRRALKRIGITTLLACAVAAIATTVAGSAGSPTPPAAATVRQEFVRHLKELSNYGLLSWPAQVAVAKMAGGQSQPSPADLSERASTRAAGIHAAGPGLTNVRVNNPSEDSHLVDQTTQSETTIGVTGQNVIVGFNDSQGALPAVLTAALNLTGYSYSSNGGKTFTDGGELPNAPGLNNLGDPSLGTDRAGNAYFSTLVLDWEDGSLGVGVAKSTDGGKTFSAPTIVSPSKNPFYNGDKDWLTVGPDPADHSRDDVYVSWDDQFANRNGRGFSGLPVARSTDGGETWQVSYAAKARLSRRSCSFVQYIGAQPVVASDGTLYVAAEKFSVDDPRCRGREQFVVSEWIFKSTDGGKTFDSGHQLATVKEINYLDLGQGMVMRTIEFPSVAIGSTGAIYVAWNDAASGHSNIRLATSTDGGSTWSRAWATTGTNDDVQPALSADKGGLNLLYYQRNDDNTLDVMLGTSENGKPPFATTRVTTTSFPGVFTVPQFDPIIAPGYMGDYIANVSDGTDQYFAWGDNRDTVTNYLWPKGRHDPNVYFAKR